MSGVPEPERPDVEDAYLRCVDCGWSYPLDSTPADERCSNCDGLLVYAIGDWDKTLVGQGEVTVDVPAERLARLLGGKGDV